MEQTKILAPAIHTGTCEVVLPNYVSKILIMERGKFEEHLRPQCGETWTVQYCAGGLFYVEMWYGIDDAPPTLTLNF